MKRILVICAFAALTTCAPPAQQASAPSSEPAKAEPIKTDAPAGAYTLDKAHASLNFRVVHLGLSHFTARFTRFDAKLQFDPGDPESSRITATIDPSSIQTNYPDPKFDFDKQLAGDKWLDAAKFPQMTYKSTSVELTGPNTATVNGDLTLHGVTQPVTLDVTFNGGYGANSMDPSGSRIGFSAKGSLKRSAFGIAYGVPAPGSAFGVGDDVEIIIETEFTKPSAPAPSAAPAAAPPAQ